MPIRSHRLLALALIGEFIRNCGIKQTELGLRAPSADAVEADTQRSSRTARRSRRGIRIASAPKTANLGEGQEHVSASQFGVGVPEPEPLMKFFHPPALAQVSPADPGQ